MTKTRRFVQCDVFTSAPTKGNGLAVVVDGDGLSDQQMRDFAAWTNLAETTFLFPPTSAEADYKVRIFTPAREMPFAGHPTLGSCASWLHTGGQPVTPKIVRQECNIGIVDVDLRGDVPAFVAPPTDIEPLPSARLMAICGALEIDPGAVVRSAALNNGPAWQVLELTDAATVLALDSGKLTGLSLAGLGLIGPHGDEAQCDYEVRMIDSDMGEDPITGSLNAAIARWMAADGRLDRDLLIAQGTCIHREGRVHIRRDPADADRILIGGETQILIEGTVRL